MEKPANSLRKPLPPLANLVLAGVALGLSYLAVSRAIDTGSLLEYGIAIVLFVMGIRNLLQARQARGKQ
jgi:hypothetical protein